MLAEGFLRMLVYREERRFVSKQYDMRGHGHCTDSFSCILPDSHSTNLQADSTEAGCNQEEQDSTPAQGLKVVPEGLSIPGCSPALTIGYDFTVCIDNCSLLEQYPDLQVGDSGYRGPPRATITQHGNYSPVSELHLHREWEVQQEPQGHPVSSIPDQGYLVMGDSGNMSVDLPGSGLEPMSNSVLNGLLEKQLEEVYMQHLTDNLARCNSHLGNSLLRGLVLPPQPSSQAQGTDSLEASLEDGIGGDSTKKISYLSTQNLVPCSSNFSSPVLRISEVDNVHLQ